MPTDSAARRGSIASEGDFFDLAGVARKPRGLRHRVVDWIDSPIGMRLFFAFALTDTVCLAVSFSGAGCDYAATAAHGATLECGDYHANVTIVMTAVAAVFALRVLLNFACRGVFPTLRSPPLALGAVVLLATAPDLVLLWSVFFLGVPPASASMALLKQIRFLQCVRPTRLITTAQSQHALFNSLWAARTPIFSTLAIVVGLVFVLSIMAMQLIGGRLHYCSDGGVLAEADCAGADALGEVREWRQRFYNYDDIFNAMLSLFVVSTRDRWGVLMWQSVDGQERGLGPVQNFNFGFTVFFVFAVFAGGFFALNIFSGVFMEAHKASLGGEKSKRFQIKSRPTQRPKRAGRLRRFAWSLTNQVQFDVAVLFVIGLDVVSMASQSGKSTEVPPLSRTKWTRRVPMCAGLFPALLIWKRIFTRSTGAIAVRDT